MLLSADVLHSSSVSLHRHAGLFRPVGPPSKQPTCSLTTCEFLLRFPSVTVDRLSLRHHTNPHTLLRFVSKCFKEPQAALRHSSKPSVCPQEIKISPKRRSSAACNRACCAKRLRAPSRTRQRHGWCTKPSTHGVSHSHQARTARVRSRLVECNIPLQTDMLLCRSSYRHCFSVQGRISQPHNNLLTDFTSK